MTLVGLGLHGDASGETGVYIVSVGFLRVYNMLIENFAMYGVEFGAGNLEIYGSTLNDNFGLGLNIANGSVNIQNTSFDHNGAAVQLMFGQASVIDSVASNGQLGFAAAGGTMTLYDDIATFNDFGILSVNPGARCISATVL